jgi:hypothetical protein
LTVPAVQHCGQLGHQEGVEVAHLAQALAGRTLGAGGGDAGGKALGVLGMTGVLSKVTQASLDSALRWIDVFGIALLAGIGFTVSLLISHLAYGVGTDRDDHVKVGVLTGSSVAAVLASIVLMIRNRHYRKICEQEARDDDCDGMPDVFRNIRRFLAGAVPPSGTPCRYVPRAASALRRRLVDPAPR